MPSFGKESLPLVVGWRSDGRDGFRFSVVIRLPPLVLSPSRTLVGGSEPERDRLWEYKFGSQVPDPRGIHISPVT